MGMFRGNLLRVRLKRNFCLYYTRHELRTDATSLRCKLARPNPPLPLPATHPCVRASLRPNEIARVRACVSHFIEIKRASWWGRGGVRVKLHKGILGTRASASRLRHIKTSPISVSRILCESFCLKGATGRITEFQARPRRLAWAEKTQKSTQDFCESVSIRHRELTLGKISLSLIALRSVRFHMQINSAG